MRKMTEKTNSRSNPEMPSQCLKFGEQGALAERKAAEAPLLPGT